MREIFLAMDWFGFPLKKEMTLPSLTSLLPLRSIRGSRP